MDMQNPKIEVELAKMSGEFALIRQDITYTRQDITHMRESLQSLQGDVASYKEEAEKKFAKASSLSGFFKASWIIASAAINIFIVAIWKAIANSN